MNEHIKIICSSCDKVILQCRCMSKDKKTVYELCDTCKEEQFFYQVGKMVKCGHCEPDKYAVYSGFDCKCICHAVENDFKPND